MIASSRPCSVVERASPLSGPLWMVAAALLYCLMGMAVRELVVVRDANVFWVGWVRFLLGAATMLLPGVLGLWPLRVRNRGAFVWRGVIGATGQFLLYVAIAQVGLGRGTVLAYLMGVFGALSAVPLLGERLTMPLAAAVIIGTGGVLLSSRAGIPAGAEWLAVLGAVCSGTALSLVRLLRRTDSNQVTFLSQGVFGSMLLVWPALMHPAPTGAGVWVLLMVMSTLDMGGQLCMTQGLSMLPVARGAALMMLTPVLSLLAGFFLFAEPMRAMQWLGCFLVLGASIIAVVLRSMPGQERTR